MRGVFYVKIRQSYVAVLNHLLTISKSNCFWQIVSPAEGGGNNLGLLTVILSPKAVRDLEIIPRFWHSSQDSLEL